MRNVYKNMPERRYHRKTYQPDKKKKRFFLVLKGVGIVFFILILGIIFLFFYYSRDFPRPEVFAERHLFQSTKIYDRSGKILLYEIYGEEKRTWVPLEEIPDYLKKAVIATEDANFYSHFGVDFRGVIRAVLADLKIMKPAYGGSTIPQQLIRSTFLSLEKTAERKTREIILSLELDRRYPKHQILEWYLNQVPFGRNAYGVEAASQAYFKKSVSDLSLSQAAILASLIKAPSFYSAKENRNELLFRKNYVLDRMAREGFLNQAEANEAKKEEINLAKFSQEILAPHFTLWVLSQLQEKYGRKFLEQEGLKIFTTLDWELQTLAEEIIKKGVKNNNIYNAHNGALVAISPKTGEILALVGSADYFAPAYPSGCISGLNCLFDPQFNVAVGNKQNPGRQPGSAFKPFIYATAFKAGYSDKNIVSDAKTNFGRWGDKEYIPRNYDGKFRGEVTLRQSLAQSLNIPSIKVLYLAGTGRKIEKLTINNFKGQEKIFIEGLKNSLKMAKEMGITTLKRPLSFYGPSLVLGGGEVKLLEMVSAYGVFANEGLKVAPTAILKIEDLKGNIIKENKKIPKRVLEKEVCRLINDILSDNTARAPMFGWNSPLYFKEHQVAVKTGTTQDCRDAWTIGYIPSLSVGVWIGNSNNSPMAKKPGATLAGPLWHNFLHEALEKFPKLNFKKPK